MYFFYYTNLNEIFRKIVYTAAVQYNLSLYQVRNSLSVFRRPVQVGVAPPHEGEVERKLRLQQKQMLALMTPLQRDD